MDSKIIADKNDECRRTFSNCRVVITTSVSYSENRDQILNAVQSFNNFKKEDDPYCEHDFGVIIVGGEKFYFKIDSFDINYRYHQEDGNRVITIMRADEY